MTTNAEAQRKKLYGLLGDLPERNRPISVGTISTERRGKYILEKLVLDLNGLEDVPAYFVRPADKPGPLPTILYNHWHGGQYDLGKDELLNGNGGLPSGPYADQLTSMGYNALCIDAWAFGERSTRSEQDTFKYMLWHGQVMWGMMVYDSIRAVDYLVSRPDVDAERLGTLGISMGSTMAWWLAALDERIKVCVDICCLTEFRAYIEAGLLSGHGIYYYVPSLLKHFTTAGINALIAPRAHLSIAGNQDGLTPTVGLDRLDVELKGIYKCAGTPQAWKMLRYDVGHVETPEARAEIVKFLQEHL